MQSGWLHEARLQPRQRWRHCLSAPALCIPCTRYSTCPCATRSRQVRLAAIKHQSETKQSSQHKRPLDTRHKAGGVPLKENREEAKSTAASIAPYALGFGIAALLGAGFLFKGQIRGYIDYFIKTVGELGPLGYFAYGGLYVLLEIVAVPAIPLTMTAGVIFGTVPGTIVVSIASTAAATIAFLIARYAARDKIKELASDNAQFKTVDRAIGKNSFKIVALLRLSPLLPLALSNYFYGLTSVDLVSYVVASWLGMLPGTIAYVTAGSYGRTVIDDGQGELNLEWWQVAVGAGITILALGYLGKIAKAALDEAEAETEAEGL